MFIVSLAIADLTVGMVVMPISTIYIFTDEWPFGLAVCQLWIGVDYTASTASILNLFILSLDRYWSVTSPLRYLSKRTKRRALVMISIVWFISSLWLIPIIGWHHFVNNGVRKLGDNQCDTEYANDISVKIITGILNYYLPVGIMYGLYSKIFMEIRKRSNLELGQYINSSKHKGSPVPRMSLSEDSDDKRRSDQVRMPAARPEVNELTIQNRFHDCDTGTGTGTETDITDDEQKIHKGSYTNLRLIRITPKNHVTNNVMTSSDVASSDSDRRVQYLYDEVVLDPTTEKVEKLLYEEHNNSANGVRSNTDSKPKRTGSRGTRILETSMTSIPTTRTVMSEKDVRFLPCSDKTQENSTRFPKEAHPVKGKVIRPRIRILDDQDTFDGDGDTDTLCTPVSPAPSPALEELPPVKKSTSRAPIPNTVVSCLSPRTTRLTLPDNTGPSKYPRHRKRHGRVAQLRDLFRSRHRQAPPSRQRQNSALIKQAVRWKKKVDHTKHRRSSALNKEIKAARQLGVIMGAFTLCFLPYFVCFMVVAFCENCVGNTLMVVVTWFGYINSTLNPFLYPLCNSNFRRKFRSMLRMKADEKDLRASKYYTACTKMNANQSYTP